MFHLYSPASPGASKASVTTGRLDIYVDGTSGNDSNNGLTAATPKATLQAGFSLIPPIVRDQVVVHLAGTITMTQDVYLQSIIVHEGDDVSSTTDAAAIYVDGGSDLTTVAGPFTSTSASKTSIVDNTQTWTPDQYFGYWVRITSGALSGQVRSIQKHDATTITPVKNFTADPDSGGAVTFDIVRPATKITASSTTRTIRIYPVGGGVGRVLFQRFFIDGTAIFDVRNPASSQFQMAAVIGDGTVNGQFGFFNFGGIFFQNGHVDPDTYAQDLTSATSRAVAVAQINNSSSIRFVNGTTYSGSGILARRIEFYSFRGTTTLFTHGSRVKAATGATTPIVEIRDVVSGNLGSSNFANTSGYAVATIDCSGCSGTNAGLLIANNSTLRCDNITINDSPSHAIRVDEARLYIQNGASVVGTGNTGAGLYAYANGMVDVTGTPTLTGTVGDVSLDGTTQAVTWANLAAGGNDQASATEFSFVRKV